MRPLYYVELLEVRSKVIDQGETKLGYFVGEE